MNALTISDIATRQEAEGRYCLNDLHKAAGGESRHQPGKWLITQQAVELVAELEKTGIPVIQAKQGLGTFVCKELVYAYAMWISPVFHLKVIRAYDALVRRPPPAPSSDPRQLLNDPANLRGLLLTYCEKVLGLEETVQSLTPKAEALDRIAHTDGSFCLIDTAKALQMRPKDLIAWLQANHWIYRRRGGQAYLAYQDKIQSGLIEMKVHHMERSDGMGRTFEQARITAKGLTKLGELVPTKPKLVAGGTRRRSQSIGR